MKKKKKKQKQVAGQKQAKRPQRATRKNTVESKVMKQEKVNDSNSSVFQNKENKVSSLQRRPHQRESTLQSQSRRLSGEPSSRTWHHPCVRDQFTQSSQQLWDDDNFSANSQLRKVKIESSQTDRPVRRPHNTQGQTAWPSISQHDYYNNQYDRDFTSDHLPQNGAIIFDHGQNESTGSSQPGQEGSRCSAQPAAADRSTNAAPIRDVDVNAMLRQIRRALGVREPCRADREARRQNGEAGVRVVNQAGAEREQPAGSSFRNHSNDSAPHFTSVATTSVQSSQVSSPAPASHSGVCPSNIAPAKPKQTTAKMAQGTTQRCEKSSAVASDSNGPSDSRERESQGALNSQTSLSRCSDRTTSSEPNLNIARRVRIAHEAGRAQVEKEAGLKPTLNKLLILSGAKSKLSWREIHEEMKRKKQDRVKGMPR